MLNLHHNRGYSPNDISALPINTGDTRSRREYYRGYQWVKPEWVLESAKHIFLHLTREYAGPVPKQGAGSLFTGLVRRASAFSHGPPRMPRMPRSQTLWSHDSPPKVPGAHRGGQQRKRTSLLGQLDRLVAALRSEVEEDDAEDEEQQGREAHRVHQHVAAGVDLGASGF